MKTKTLFNTALTTALVAGGLTFANAQYNAHAEAAPKYNSEVGVAHTRVHVKSKYLYTSLSMKHRVRINNKKVFIYESYIHFTKGKHKGVWKYVKSGKVHGWVKSSQVKKAPAKAKASKKISGSITIKLPSTSNGSVKKSIAKKPVVKKTTVKKTVAKKAVKKTTTKAKYTTKDQYYIPNAENVKAEFKKLLDPYLAKYNKTYGVPTDMSPKYTAIVDKGDDGQDYGGEYVVTSGNVVQSDKAMAKELFNGLLHGTLMDNLKDPSRTNVIIDHVTFDGKVNLTNPGKTPLGIDARLYLTWYWNFDIDSPYVISTHSNTNTNDSEYDE